MLSFEKKKKIFLFFYIFIYLFLFFLIFLKKKIKTYIFKLILITKNLIKYITYFFLIFILKKFYQKGDNNIMLKNFYFSFPGYLTFNDFKKIVDRKQIMHQGNTIGKYCKLDADNYYCKLIDLNKSENIWEKI